MAETAVEQQEQQETPATPEKKKYSFQPKDEEGRPLGGPQVIEYDTDQELADKLAANYEQAQRHIRKLRRDMKLGNYEKEELPQDAELNSNFDDEPVRELTAAEKYEIARDLNDPEKFDEARDKLVKSSPLGQEIRQTRKDIAILRAKEEAKAFVEATPEYFPCKENFETIAGWCIKNNLSPTKKNFQLAFTELNKLTSDGVALLIPAPVAVEDETQANTQPEPEEAGRIPQPEPAPTKRSAATATGLNRTNSSNTGGGGGAAKSKLTMADIDKMPADEYKRKYKTDPAFRKLVDAL